MLDKQIKAKPALPHAPTKKPPLNWSQAFFEIGRAHV